MATKKKRTITARARSTRVKKSTSLINRLFSSKRNIVYLIIGLMGLVGVFALLSTSAATPPPAPNNNAPQRFPGDPNPLVSGKRYIGTSLGRNGKMVDPKARYEDPTGKSLSARRMFISSWSSRQQAVDLAKDSVSKNRLPVVSIKPAGWNEMATSSQRQNEIDDFLRKLDSVGGPVWLVVHHEANGGHGRTIDDPGGTAAYKAMQKKFRSRMNTLGTNNVALVANLICNNAFGNKPSIPISEWWVDGVWDVFTVDYYTKGASTVPETAAQWTNFAKWAKSKNIPYGLLEWNNIDEPEATRGKELKNFWNWMNTNDINRDGVIWTQWDSDTDGPQYMVDGTQLDAFRDILKNDPRVQRIDDLGRGGIVPAPSPSPTPTPTPNNATTINITSPAANATVSGAVTVRVDASDSDGIGSVNFRINDKWHASDDTAPYEWKTWDTTKLADGTHQVVVRVRDKLGNMTEKSISVKTQNNSANVGILQPPQNLIASLGSFNFANFVSNKVPYEINLQWSNSSAYSYDVVRSGQFIGATNGTAFTDKSGLQLGHTYYYEITSKDGKGGKSTSSSTSVNVACALFWCNLQNQ